MTMFTVPVVLGGGKKLFADGSAPHAYKLAKSRVSSTGAHLRPPSVCSDSALPRPFYGETLWIDVASRRQSNRHDAVLQVREPLPDE
jgi:hypothetical protein